MILYRAFGFTVFPAYSSLGFEEIWNCKEILGVLLLATMKQGHIFARLN
jgi:hypothetical protein